MDLQTAWKRYNRDTTTRHFVRLPYVIDLIKQSIDNWLAPLNAELENRSYSPQAAITCEIPKPGFNIRPATLLQMRDWIVYYATLQKLMPKISKYILDGEQKDFNYRLSSNINAVPWYQRSKEGWNQFREKSLLQIDAGKGTVLFTDIAGFYENIEFRILQEQLVGAGVADAELGQLRMCLNRWAHPRGKGIPQGCSPSDILAKLYLISVDRHLERLGFTHMRYSDDFRIFCSNKLEAKRALRELTRLLREIGLNLQTKKTAILDSLEAKEKILGAVPRIRELEILSEDEEDPEPEEASYGDEVEDEGDELNVVVTRSLTDLEEESDEAEEHSGSIAVLERAFTEDFIDKNFNDFNSTLFHYVLGGLRKYHSDFALSSMVTVLKIHPEETADVLKYVERFQSINDFLNEVIEYCLSDEAIYEYQIYLIVEFMFKNQLESSRIREFTRILFQRIERPFWLRASIVALLGQVGNEQDLEVIEATYATADRDEMKAITICSLKRMSINRRNSFYARCGGDGFLVSQALRWARESH